MKKEKKITPAEKISPIDAMSKENAIVNATPLIKSKKARIKIKS